MRADPVLRGALFVAPLVGLLVVAGYFLWAMPALAPHTGDGTFQDTSWRYSFGIPVPGYEIDFSEFDLGQEFQAEYAFSHLPEILPTAGIYLAIWDPDQKFRSDPPRKQLTANFKFELVDEDGSIVAQLDRPLSEMWWARPEGGDYGLYQLDESFFQPSGDKRYRLRVRFMPDAALEGMKGFIHIRCGGSI